MGYRLTKHPQTKALALYGGCCGFPFAHVVGDKLRIIARHEKARHPLNLSAEDLRRIADALEKKDEP